MIEEIWNHLEGVSYFGVACAAIAWLVKSLCSQLMRKDVEALKHQLEKAALEHKVTFESLHKQRAEALIEYYREISKVDSVIKAFRVSNRKTYTKADKKLLSAAVIGVQNCSTMLKKNEIFFRDDLTKRAHELNVKMLQYAGSALSILDIASEAASSIEEPIPQERIDLVSAEVAKWFREAEDKLTPLLNDIRAEFQKLLGIV